MALRCLFVVQGEGRGHLTQAMALRRMLREAGHRVEGTVVGNVEAWLVDGSPELVELGWTFSPAVAGRGYATEAVDALIEHVFSLRQIHRVTAQMDGRNDASARLAARVGMRQEAHFRQNWWCKGEWTDTLVYAMLREDR